MNLRVCMVPMEQWVLNSKFYLYIIKYISMDFILYLSILYKEYIRAPRKTGTHEKIVALSSGF